MVATDRKPVNQSTRLITFFLTADNLQAASTTTALTTTGASSYTILIELSRTTLKPIVQV